MTGHVGGEWARALFAEHGRAVRAYAARRISADEVDDVVVDVFVVAWRRRDIVEIAVVLGCMALDATVESVDGDSITLTVNEWLRGGDAASITLQGASTLSGITSAGEAVSLEPGTRLLVAGDGGFAWSCGFTQPYDSAVADGWRGALSS